jgi:hypothetical protein
VTTYFEAVVLPEDGLLADISLLSPGSPFNTPAYALALSSRNAEPCALTLRNGDGLVAGCLSSLAGSRWNKRLEIFTAPDIDDPDVFWEGVATFCRDKGVCDLDVQSFASSSPTMPTYEKQLRGHARSEYIIDLASDSLLVSFSKRHKGSIKKAQKLGMEVTRSDSLNDYKVHVEMMRASMTRRSNRGENVTMPSARAFDFALLHHGAGELFQARLNERVIASMLVLKARNSGYYYSAGTSPEGMKLGASPFLIGGVAQVLAESGYRYFNLGGVDPGADGLRRFKEGFGAIEVRLTTATYSMISPVNRALRTCARRIKSVPQALMRSN